LEGEGSATYIVVAHVLFDNHLEYDTGEARGEKVMRMPSRVRIFVGINPKKRRKKRRKKNLKNL